MILLLSNGEGDQPIEEVKDWIDFYGGDAIRINSNEMMFELNYSFQIDNRVNKISFYKENFHVELSQINVIWYWRWHYYGLEEIQWAADHLRCRKFMNTELESIIHFVLKTNPNLYIFGDKYINKLDTLIKAAEIGLTIPETLVTREKDKLIDFFEEHQNIIIKPLSNPIFFEKDKKTYGMYTQKLCKDEIYALPEVFFPILIQKEIKKNLEIRSFFIDNLFYSAAIISQNDEMTIMDFRNYNLANPNRIIPYQLPKLIENKLRKLFHSLGLKTGSIDIIYNGDYIILEINPVGQFGMISYPCNYNLSETIAKHLIQKDIAYDKK